MENEYIPVSVARANGDLSNSPAYLITNTCSEKFLGRCNKCQIPEIQFCKTYEGCEISHKIMSIKQVNDKK